MERERIGWLAVGAVAIAGTAIAAHDTGMRHIGGQTFAVPKHLSYDARIPWLPDPETDSFVFLLEPSTVPNTIPPHRVLVEDTKRVCANGGTSPMVKVACRGGQSPVEIGPPYAKVFPHPDYPYEWVFYGAAAGVKDGQTNRFQVAYCTPISPNSARPRGTAICTAMWGAAGLVLSLSFEENELAHLPAMEGRATHMLLSWKVS